MALWRGSRLAARLLRSRCAPPSASTDSAAWVPLLPQAAIPALGADHVVRWPRCWAGIRAACQSAAAHPRDADDNRTAAASLLQSINAFNLREALERDAGQRVHMTHDELIEKCLETRAAISREEAERLCEALCTAGVVMRYKDVVFLRPGDVAEMILCALPETRTQIQGNLDALREKIAPLRSELAGIDERADAWSNRIVVGGLALLVLQFALFFRLTYWELSWDVMEPVGYFASLGMSILAYAYFLITREDFATQSLRERIRKHFVNKELKRKNIDVTRYQELLSSIHKFERYLVRAKL
ncbi:unnamed protein product [Ostreobium quekettii]|uniref:Calcium uniporter protein C-terminal domain-containing protein n=1 Tax=Ostreobium quekettii TaxID=121088 RepID=A0A8S1J1W0_9CHLO|nr:unnamed protein product [Ostreobium quekettii]